MPNSGPSLNYEPKIYCTIEASGANFYIFKFLEFLKIDMKTPVSESLSCKVPVQGLFKIVHGIETSPPPDYSTPKVI